MRFNETWMTFNELCYCSGYVRYRLRLPQVSIEVRSPLGFVMIADMWLICRYYVVLYLNRFEYTTHTFGYVLYMFLLVLGCVLDTFLIHLG